MRAAGTVPELRTSLKILKQSIGVEKATRKYIYALFSYGYGQQACKIADMRLPRKLWLDVLAPHRNSHTVQSRLVVVNHR